MMVYTDRVLGPRAGGDTRAFVVFIRPKYRQDEGIREHELTHVWQWWMGCVIGFFASGLAAWFYLLQPWWSWLVSGALLGGTAHVLLYYFSRRYRLWAEARAYRQQMLYPDRNGVRLSLDEAAVRLGDNELYKLGVTVDQAREALKGS